MARRGNGEGSVYRRKNGTWAAALEIDGRRHFVYAPTQREAREKLTSLRAAAARGVKVGSRETVGEYLRRWIDSVKPAIGERTWEGYESIIRVHLTPALGHVRLDKLSTLDVRQLVARLASEGRANNTIHHVGACLRTALREAVTDGLMPQGNVAITARVPPLRRVEYETWNADEVRAFLAAAAGDEFEALYWLAITTGARQGELFALRRSAFERRGPTLSVQASVSRRRRRTLTKNASSVRLIDLDRDVAELVAEHLRCQPLELRGEGLIFPHPVRGGMLDNSFLYVRRFKPLVARAGLRQIRFHDLRHTAARLMLEGGLLPHEVGRILGHSDPSTTLRLYAPWIRLNRPDVARVMGAVIRGSGDGLRAAGRGERQA